MAYDQAVPLLELFHKDSEGSYDFSPEYSDEQPSDKQIGIAFPKERTQSRNPLEPSDRSRTSTPVPISNDLRLNSQRQDALNATNDRFSANDCSTMNSENPFALAEYDGVLESGRVSNSDQHIAEDVADVAEECPPLLLLTISQA